MQKLVQYSDVEIMVRVAKRASLLRKAQEERANDIRLAFDEYLGAYLELNGLDKQVLNDTTARDFLVKSVGNI